MESQNHTFSALGPPKTRPRNVDGPAQVASIPLKCACTALFTATRFDGRTRWFSKGNYIRITCPKCGAIDKMSKAKLLAMLD